MHDRRANARQWQANTSEQRGNSMYMLRHTYPIDLIVSNMAEFYGGIKLAAAHLPWHLPALYNTCKR
jgi:hypothetical protein